MQTENGLYIMQSGICSESDLKEIMRLLNINRKEWEWADKTEVTEWLLNENAILYKNTAAVLCKTQNGKLGAALMPVLKRIKVQADAAVLIFGDYGDILPVVQRLKEEWHKRSPVLLLPVKPRPPLEGLFQNGFVLSAAAPLCNLRPFYLFTLSKGEKTSYNIKEILPCADSYNISRLLEHGYIGIAAQSGEKIIMAK